MMLKQRFVSATRLLLGLACALSIAAALSAPIVHAASAGVVISQIYGGGGNSGATLKNDFIELFNRGIIPVDVTGWTVQYASAAGSTWSSTTLSGVIPPGGHYLVQEAQGAGGSVDLPTPDVVGTIAMSATAAKVALVSNAIALSGTCPAGPAIVDLVGYGGTANCFETAAAGGLSNTTAALRQGGGCVETDNNSSDFASGAPNPRNSASPASPCEFSLGITVAPPGGGTVARVPDQATYAPGTEVELTATPTLGWSFVGWSGDAGGSDNPLTVTMDRGKSITATFAINTFTLTTNVVGDGTVARVPDQATYEYGLNVQLTATAAVGWHFVGWSGDAGGSDNPLAVTMDGAKTITATFEPNAVTGEIVISQVYGGGGNSGALLKNDFVELFNRGATPVSLAGWAVQYASAAGTTWLVTPLSGTVPAGGYYLVQQAEGAGGTVDLPTPDAFGTVAMSATAGKVALVNSIAALTGDCPAGAEIIDLVGYGATASCSETAPAGGLNNTTAVLRKSGGCQETNDNSADFELGAPAPRNSASPVRLCQYTLATSVEPPGGGSIARSPDQATYQHGSTVELTATPVSGYRFTGWSGDASGTENPLTVLMDDAKSIVGNFTLNTPSAAIVISQIYGGGGNSGALYKNDFVELYNRGNMVVNVTGWTVQYASAGGSTWETVTLTGSMAPGRYYLVQLEQGVGGTLDLPAPDAIGTFALEAHAGKVALVSELAVLVGGCPANATIQDLVGYGAATCFEGAPLAALNNTHAALRNGNGCDDTNDNALDITIGDPAPRNSATAVNICSGWLAADDPPVKEFMLAPVSPNPSHGSMRITFALPREAEVKLRVMDLQGRLVANLTEGSFPAGRHEVTWNSAASGGAIRPGLYFIRLDVPGNRYVRSAVVTR